MSSGQFCFIRDLGLVKGGKGLKHHEVVLELSWRGLIRFAGPKIGSNGRTNGPVSEEPEGPIQTTCSST
jgi:hypothetical protein